MVSKVYSVMMSEHDFLDWMEQARENREDPSITCFEK